MAKHLNVSLDFTANTKLAENLISKLSSLLNKIAYGTNINVNTASMKLAVSAAKELQYHLNKAYNPETGNIDLSKFNLSLKQSKLNVSLLASNLTKAGKTGLEAFVSMSKALANAELPMLKVNSLLTEMWTVMKNTMRWQIASSALHGLTSGLSNAMSYAKLLNKSLTDIRIVAPEKSIEDMAKFAKQANEAAKELSTSTLDYTEAALIYYQLGLSDTETAARSDVTIKMANVTGDSADDVSSYMTSIWNNFNLAGDESEEHFADVLTRLGADTAASTSEITTGLEKYSAVANTIGLSYEAATSAVTTLIDRTRETPEVAGTALKTIFARLQGLKLNGTTGSEDGEEATSLNKYSEGLAAVGVQIKDVNGELKDADTILDEIGEVWNSGALTLDVKVALAQTVAGLRQYNQFMSLMDNYDSYKEYKLTAETGSEGSLEELQKIYAESWEGASERVKASILSIYMLLLDDLVFIKITNDIATLIEGLDDFIDGIGGLKGVLLAVGTFALTGLKSKILPALEGLVRNINVLTGNALKEYSKLSDLFKNSTTNLLNSNNYSMILEQEIKGSLRLLEVKSKLSLVNKKLSDSERMLAELAILGIELLNAELIKLAEKKLELNEQVDSGFVLDFDDLGLGNTLAEKRNNSYLKEMEQEVISQDSLVNDELYEQLTNRKMDAEEATRQFLNSLLQESEAALTAENREQLLINTMISGETACKGFGELFISLANEIANGNIELELGLLQLSFLREIIVSLGPEFNEVKQQIEIAFQTSSPEDFKNALISAESELKKLNIPAEKIEEIFNKLGQGNNFLLLIRDIELAREATLQLEDAEELVNNEVDNFNPTHTITAIEGVSAAAAGLGGIAMTFMSINSAIETLKNPDISGWEKFTTVLMSISMIIPSIMTTINTISTLLKTQTGQIIIETIALKALNDVLTQNEILLFLLGKGIGASIAKKIINIMLTKEMTKAEKMNAIAELLEAEAIDKNTQSIVKNNLARMLREQGLNKAKNIIKAILSLLKKIIVSGPGALAIVASLSAIGTKLAYDYAHKARKNLEEITLAVEDSKNATADLVSQALELGSAWDSLENKKDSLKDLTYGTTEWNNAVSDLNSNTIDTIDKFNELNDTLINAEELGLDGDLVYGLDWSYASDGTILLDKDAEFKLATIETAIVNLATINDAKDDYILSEAEYAAAREELTEGILGSASGANGSGEKFHHSEYWVESGKTSTWKSGSGNIEFELGGKYLYEEITSQTINAITDAILNNEITKGDFGFTSDGKLLLPLLDLVDQGLITDSLADLLAANIDNLSNKLYDNTIELKKNTEKYQATLANDILTNENNAYYKGIKKLDKNYLSGAADWIAELQVNRERLYASKWTTLSKDKQENWESKYASSKGWKKDGKKWVDEEGEELEINERNILSYYEQTKAQKDLNKHKKQYLLLLKQEIDDSKSDWKSLKNIKTIAEDYSKVVKKFSGNFNNKDIKTYTNSLNKFASAIKDDLVEAMDIANPENYDTIMNPEFMANNMALINDAMNGNAEALDSLYDKYATEDIKLRLDIDDNAWNELNPKIQEMLNQINDLTIGTSIDGTGLRKGLNEILSSCEMTRDNAMAILDDMGINAEIVATDLGENEATESRTNLIPEESEQSVTLQNISNKVTTSKDGGFASTFSTLEGPKIKGVKWKKGKTVNATSTKDDGQLHTWKITKGTGVTKVKHNTLPKTSRTRRTPSSPTSSDSGSRGSSRRVERARRLYEKSTVVERYKEITDKLDRTEKISSKLAKTQDELYGKARLKAMDEVNKKHLEEIKLLQTKSKEARQYLLQDLTEANNKLKEALSIAKSTSSFDTKHLTSSQINAIKNAGSFNYNEFGEITNYTSIMTALLDLLNAYERYYNNEKNFNSEESQNTYKEKNITPLTEAIDRLQEAIDLYDETRELIEELRDLIDDAYTEWQELNYEKLTYSLELKVTVNDNDLKLVEYYIDKMTDNIYKAAEVLEYYISKSTLNKLSVTEESVKTYIEHLKELNLNYNIGKITQDSYVTSLKEVYSLTMDNLTSLQNLEDEMKSYYGNTLSSVIEELDLYTERLDNSASLLDHYKSILELSGKTTDYDALEKILNANAILLTGKINLTKATYELSKIEYEKLLKLRDDAYAEMMKVQTTDSLKELKLQELNTLTEELTKAKADTANYNETQIAELQELYDSINNMTDEQYKDSKEKQYDFYNESALAALETMEDTQDQMLSSIEDAMLNSADALTTALEKAAAALEDLLTGIVGGFEEITRQMDLTSLKQEEYLTKTNLNYELNKMLKTLASDIDKTDSKAAKTKLANFSKELKALEEKDSLSNLELEIALKKYELLKALIALEETQNAKLTIRLSRDNEGNYGYVYVANEENVDEAELAVADAENDLYNTLLEATNDYGQKYILAIQSYKDELESFYNGDEIKTMTEQEIAARVSAIQSLYGDLITSYKDLYGIAYGSTDELVSAILNESWVYSNYNSTIENMTTNLSAFDTYVKDSNSALSVWTAQIKNLTDIYGLDTVLETLVKDTETTVNAIATEFEETGERLVKTLDLVRTELDTFIEESLPVMDYWTATLEGMADKVKDILSAASEGDLPQTTKYFNQLLTLLNGNSTTGLKYTEDTYVAYTEDSKYGVTAAANSWTADTIAKNEITANSLITDIASGYKGYFGFDKDGVMSYIKATGGVDKTSTEYKNWIKDIVSNIASFDTGGYTGDIEGGQLAILHDKELVLNANDTSNMLSIIEAVRDLTSSGFLTALKSVNLQNGIQSNLAIDLTVTIDAQFPNVTDRNEIEQAFNNLVNRAAQHAYK